jgi:hypothetical protein
MAPQGLLHSPYDRMAENIRAMFKISNYNNMVPKMLSEMVGRMASNDCHVIMDLRTPIHHILTFTILFLERIHSITKAL